jgi:UDPglucose 6-dehydrogenase
MTKNNIGIIGKGFVGGAVAFGFSPSTGYESNIRIFDKDPDKSTHTLEEVVSLSDFIFISVPTPSNKDGSINTSILESVIDDINTVLGEKRLSYNISKINCCARYYASTM